MAQRLVRFGRDFPAAVAPRAIPGFAPDPARVLVQSASGGRVAGALRALVLVERGEAAEPFAASAALTSGHISYGTSGAAEGYGRSPASLTWYYKGMTFPGGVAAQLPAFLPGMETPDAACHLTGPSRLAATEVIVAHHYTHSVPSGKSRYYSAGPAIVVFSLPANNNVARWLLGPIGHPGNVWELARLWAPDGHGPDLLTWAVSRAVRAFRGAEPAALALISYADPNVGHAGGIYRAASWIYLGQVEDGRYYRGPDGQVVPRRKFHSGRQFIRKPDILALGFSELTLPGRHRFARGLTPGARRAICRQQQVRAGKETARGRPAGD